ncbi:MAG: HAMP domain-containing protein [Parachlamydiaceae bacterium]|nr:HAMP domain-containing protein [Parachlamydiaceae bacterium]
MKTLRSQILRLLFIPIGLLLVLIAVLLYLTGAIYIPMFLAAVAVTVLLIVLFTILSAVVFSEKIRTPLQQIQDTALSIAAEDYKERLHVTGSQEIVDLASAFNTLSECLQESFNRLRESAVLRERMYGEYECALLLQQHMLQRVLENELFTPLQIRALTHTSASTLNGVLLDVLPQAEGTELSLYEAREQGFIGIYNLLLSPDTRSNTLTLTFNPEATSFSFQTHDMPAPLLWSTERADWVYISQAKQILEKHDIILLYNRGLALCFNDTKGIQDWFQKVLKHFAAEGFDLFLTMLQHELSVLTKKHAVSHDIHLLCLHKE